jgi:hypothetical protein
MYPHHPRLFSLLLCWASQAPNVFKFLRLPNVTLSYFRPHSTMWGTGVSNNCRSVQWYLCGNPNRLHFQMCET